MEKGRFEELRESPNRQTGQELLAYRDLTAMTNQGAFGDEKDEPEFVAVRRTASRSGGEQVESAEGLGGAVDDEFDDVRTGIMFTRGHLGERNRFLDADGLAGCEFERSEFEHWRMQENGFLGGTGGLSVSVFFENGLNVGSRWGIDNG